jgi:GNAT superfamily N-acetyltransferase
MNPAQICLRSVNQEDVPFLLELRRQTMHPHLPASGYIPSLEDDMRRVLLRLDSAQLVRLANQPVGLLKVSRDGNDWDLIRIQLAPSLQGQGFGTELIQSVINEARQAGASLPSIGTYSSDFLFPLNAVILMVSLGPGDRSSAGYNMHRRRNGRCMSFMVFAVLLQGTGKPR